LVGIEEQISKYAAAKGIKPEAYDQFREGILKGLKVLGLRTDRIDERKYNMIANRKETKEVLEWTKTPNESASQTAYHPMQMFEGRPIRSQ